MVGTSLIYLKLPTPCALMIEHYPDPADALEAERGLVERFSDPCVNFHVSWWTTTQCLIAPCSLRRAPNIDSAIERSTSSDWPVYFRQTGGELTPQGAGVINVAVAFALDPIEQPSIVAVYEMFCTPIIRWLKDNGCEAQTGSVPGSFCDGEFNIIVDGRKVAGTAQRWTRIRAVESRQVVFAHALLLLDADLQSGVDAINQLYKSCLLQQIVQASKQVNICDVLLEPTHDWQAGLVKSLSEMYEEELAALTS